MTVAVEKAVKERPILFKGEMVKAILAGKKTQTRRVIKPLKGFEYYNIIKPEMVEDPYAVWMHGEIYEQVGVTVDCPFGKPGERLWVKENAYISGKHFGYPQDANCQDYDGDYRVVGYSASMDSDSVRAAKDYGVKQRGAMLMPRWASRITLEVTNVRVERLNEISGRDACWEGAPYETIMDDSYDGRNYLKGFRELWDRINGKKYPWESNPWVWVVEFKKIEVSA